jgi:outer membrane protein assembly factor BamB
MWRGVPLLAALVLLLSGCDWTMFRFGPQHTGYNPGESTIGVGNVGTLVQKWRGATGSAVYSSPAVANGVVYVDSIGDSPNFGFNGKLSAFSAAGTTNCSGTPKACSPLWTFTPPNDVSLRADFLYSSPAVVNGVVYVVSFCVTDCFTTTSALYALDASGTTNCSGTPKTCNPLWTAPVPGDKTSPVVANGVVYVSAGSSLLAFDASGTTDCAGTPKTCSPLWGAGTYGALDTPAVANGVVYVGTRAGPTDNADGRLSAFDANGKTNCSAVTKTCNPLWTASVGYPTSSPAVANGVVYIGSQCYYCGITPAEINGLFGFDASGTTNCSGTPKTCNPLWVARTASAVNSSPAVANGMVYVGSDDGTLYAFNAATGVNVWAGPGGGSSSPAVANGVVYGASDKLYALDAAGHTSCFPLDRVCSALWTAATGGSSSPAVVNGVVYVGSGDSLYAYGLP